MWGGGVGGRGEEEVGGSVECGWVGTWGWVGVWSSECTCGRSGGVNMGVDGYMYVCVLVGAVCVVYICAMPTQSVCGVWCVHAHMHTCVAPHLQTVNP